MKNPRNRKFVIIALIVVLFVGGAVILFSRHNSNSSDVASSKPSSEQAAMLDTRLSAIKQALDNWTSATTLQTAHEGAEAVSNLIIGPDVTGYGDIDKNGIIAGENTIGLLPSETDGKGLSLPSSTCVEKDVLGGSWSNPKQRWAILNQKIAEWSDDNNTFPTLPSHPQRMVGWASLTLNSDSLEKAHEYASHTHLHLDVTTTAIKNCKG